VDAESFACAIGAEFYAGVPDSLLKPLCDYLEAAFGRDYSRHVIAANEGCAAAVAAGYHLATGKTAAVYMQNSGEGNMANPAASLLSEKVYGIPCVFIIGWRGEPGIPDEPQHALQGEITLSLLDVLGVSHFVVDRDVTPEELAERAAKDRILLGAGRSVAYVVRKGALSYSGRASRQSLFSMSREEGRAMRRRVRRRGRRRVHDRQGWAGALRNPRADGAGPRV
jgi:phosphonopyruvate decarboxylase